MVCLASMPAAYSPSPGTVPNPAFLRTKPRSSHQGQQRWCSTLSLWLTCQEVRINAQMSVAKYSSGWRAPQPTRPAQGLSLHVQPAEMMCRIYSPHFFLHLSHHFATGTDALPVPVGGRIFPFTTPAVIKFRATKGASHAVKHHQKKGGVEDKRPQILGPPPRYRETLVFFPHSHLPWFTSQYKGKKNKATAFERLMTGAMTLWNW